MATSKKRRGKKTAESRIPAFAAGGVLDLPVEDAGNGDHVSVNENGVVSIENSDGSITIDPTGASLWQKPDTPSRHDENLALKIDPLEQARIAEDLLTAIQSDKQDRAQWEQMRAKCIELMGLKLEDPKGDVSRSAMGMATSVARDPTLQQAVEFFRANAYGELCPSSGPVKVVNFQDTQTNITNDLASALQTDLNYYMTTTASEYYPDTYYMLWWTGLTSGTFKKVYMCPLRRRPVSEYVDGTNLIVPTTATDLKNAGRVTHEIQMRRSVMKRMQILGVYRDVALVEPIPTQVSPVDAKKASVEGKAPNPQRPEDVDYTVYECYCELDIKGFEHKEDGEPSGLPLPYRVTIDETSRQVLEIRRNWDEDDPDTQANIPFVLFPFSTGLSRIYGSGLGQMMGNVSSALTALLRISIDNGILGNYPGMIKAKGPGRDLVNEIMVPPGGCMEIDTGGNPIQSFIMPLPYKDVSGNVIQLMEQTRGVAKQLGGTADIPVGEGKQDAPVGTTLALIEQGTKTLSATHKVLHAAQAEEFRLLVKLFKDDPEALWRGNRRPALGNAATEAAKAERLAKFKAALDSCDIQPMADPNVPSEMHRKLMAFALKQLTAGNPAYNQVAIDQFIVKTVFKMSDADFNKFLAPPQQPQPDPTAAAALQVEQQKVAVQVGRLQLDQQKAAIAAQQQQADRESKENIEAMRIASTHGAAGQPDPLKAADLALKQQQVQLGQDKLLFDTHNAQADRDSKEAVEAMKIAQTVGVHPGAGEVVDQQLAQMAPFLEPAQNASGGGVIQPYPEHEEAVDPADLADAMDLAYRMARIQAALRETNGPLQ